MMSCVLLPFWCVYCKTKRGSSPHYHKQWLLSHTNTVLPVIQMLKMRLNNEDYKWTILLFFVTVSWFGILQSKDGSGWLIPDAVDVFLHLGDTLLHTLSAEPQAKLRVALSCCYLDTRCCDHFLGSLVCFLRGTMAFYWCRYVLKVLTDNYAI